jgi:hypothetical protein
MLDDKPQIDTTWNLKWKTSTEDWLVKLLYLIRTQRETTQEQQHALRKLKECWTYWNSDSQDWIKHGMTISLPSNPNDMNENQDGN